MPVTYHQSCVWHKAVSFWEFHPSLPERAAQRCFVRLINAQPAQKVEDDMVAAFVLHELVPVATCQCLDKLRLPKFTQNLRAGKAV